MCKATAGIIGVTIQEQARDRFCISWSLRSDVSNRTMKLFINMTMTEILEYSKIEQMKRFREFLQRKSASRK
ncbi:hypothetical protein DPMN_175079 [Dreissena polymorpha]|uniref:Uncharacterized protein n=1 Tax=Dreissena polymorpha TaxID=45954 RepID=A0A9D4E7I5_DREPO|nr:hypothetical protein DPMN_175079 [Dreissena polymorpha]